MDEVPFVGDEKSHAGGIAYAIGASAFEFFGRNGDGFHAGRQQDSYSQEDYVNPAS